MGTRGLRIVRFRGRYFLYWNQYDSYPEGLGKKLVDQVPTDLEQYKSLLSCLLLSSDGMVSIADSVQYGSKRNVPSTHR